MSKVMTLLRVVGGQRREVPGPAPGRRTPSATASRRVRHTRERSIRAQVIQRLRESRSRAVSPFVTTAALTPACGAKLRQSELCASRRESLLDRHRRPRRRGVRLHSLRPHLHASRSRRHPSRSAPAPRGPLRAVPGRRPGSGRDFLIRKPNDHSRKAPRCNCRNTFWPRSSSR